MAQAYAGGFLIESYYAPGELETASAGRRLGSYTLDFVISVLTLGIGWLIWFIIVAPRGQTPGKQLVGLYIIRDDGTRAGGGYTWVREVLVKGILFGVIAALTAYIAWILSALWLLWDDERQCLWDKVVDTHIGYSPNGFRPMTASEVARSGGRPASGMVARDSLSAQAEVRSSSPPTPSAGSAPASYESPPEPANPEPVAPSSDETPSAAQRPEPQAVGEQLRELKRLYDEDLITQQEYDERRARLVDLL